MKRLSRASYDVVVAGGGLAGVCAALAAARHGARTAIVQDRPVFGGASSSECRVHPGGANQGNAWARETGLIEELGLEGVRRSHEPFENGLMASAWDLVLYEAVRAEPHLTPHLNTSVRAVEMSGERIAAVVGEQLGSERRLVIAASLFVDCTGDGTVGALAGADLRMGREGKAEFNEPHAPDTADNKTQGSSLLFRSRDVGRPVPFTPPPWAEDYSADDSLYIRRIGRMTATDYAGYWWVEIGAPFDTIDQNEEIRDELLRHVLGVWDRIKNHGDYGAENLALEWIGMVPVKRESRRLMGDHVLTENDQLANAAFPDRIAYGGWFIDVHTMGGILAKDQAPEPSMADPILRSELAVRTYSIPLRSCYSRNVPNLLMAGRCFSATHMGLGSPRVQCTLAAMGQAVGTAAAVCVRDGLSPRELATDPARVAALQQTLLKDDCFILDCPNADPADLARGASVQATSEAPLVLEPTERIVKLDEHEYAQIFPVSAERVETVSLHLETKSEAEREVTLEFLPATDVWSFNEEPPARPVVVTATVSRGGWVDFHLGARTVPGRLYRINVRRAGDLGWTRAAAMPGVAAAWRAEGMPRWIGAAPVGAMRLDPPSRPFAGANVVSGTARPERWTNIWISDQAQPLPQAVTLDLGAERRFNTVYLSFDTNLDLSLREVSIRRTIPQCARDYRVLVGDGRSWRAVAGVTGNDRRRRVHRFEPVEASHVRLEVLATHGDPSARLYEIRVYHELDGGSR